MEDWNASTPYLFGLYIKKGKKNIYSAILTSNFQSLEKGHFHSEKEKAISHNEHSKYQRKKVKMNGLPLSPVIKFCFLSENKAAG